MNRKRRYIFFAKVLMRLISKKVLTLKTFVIMSMHIPQEIGGSTACGKDVFGSMVEPHRLLRKVLLYVQFIFRCVHGGHVCADVHYSGRR